MLVLTEDERAFKKRFRIENWTNTKKYKRKEDLYFSALDAFAVEIGLGPDGAVNGRTLTQLLAAICCKDRELANYFEKYNKNGTDLQRKETWAQLYLVAAGAVVERWFRAKRQLDLVHKNVLASEDELEGRIERLLAAQREQTGRILEADEADRVAQYTLPTAQRVDLSVGLAEAITALLRDEVTIAQDAEGDIGVPKGERDREVAKRALMRLKNKVRRVALDEGLAHEGSEELVAERIVRHHHVSEEEIAQLVIDYEEGTPERGYLTRLVPLAAAPNLEGTEQRLQRFNGKYIRTGVARWFVFEEISLNGDVLRIRGTLRYYRVSPKVEDETYSLAAQIGESEITVELRRHVSWLEISARKGGDTQALAAALQTVAEVRSRAGLPLSVRVPEGPMFSWDSRTVFMLDFLDSWLPDQFIKRGQMSMAHFEADPSTYAKSVSTPDVRAVRLEGQELMSHRQSCELIVASRGLVSISLSVMFQERDVYFGAPCRFELAPKFATVFTGFSEGVSQANTRKLHDLLVEKVRRAIEGGLRDPARTNALAQVIAGRAIGENPDRADVLPGEASAPATGESEMASSGG